MKSNYTHPITFLGASGLAALLALTLSGCGERPEEQPAVEQPGAAEMAREKEAERRPGAEQPEAVANDVDYTDEYTEPRESWTGGSASDAAFTDVAETDARAEQALRQALAAREGMSDVEVEVTDGIAHLTGEVDSMVTRREVEDIVLAMQGVAEVRNDLQAPTMNP